MNLSDSKNDIDRGIEASIKRGITKKWLLRSIVATVIILAWIYFAPKIIYSLFHESTDDAFVTGTIVPISAEVKGLVVNVFVNDNDFIRAGEPLLEIYSEDYFNIVRGKGENLSTLIAQKTEIEASIEEKKKTLIQACANLEAAIAEERLSIKELKRYEGLLRGEVVPQSEYDRVESQCIVAKARREAVHAAVAQIEAALETLKSQLKTQNFRIKEAEISLNLAKLDLRRTLIVAPISGRIAKKNVDLGKYIQIGQPLLSIVDEKHIWIVANFKETKIKDMKIGQPVDIKVDSYHGMIFKGHVESFQPGTGAVFSLFPPENATGNYVKVVQRVPVKIVLDSHLDHQHPLWPGMSVIPYVDITIKKGTKLKDPKHKKKYN